MKKVYEIYVGQPNGDYKKYPMSEISDFTAACRLRDYVIGKVGHTDVNITNHMVKVS